jgi:hypothetical protein
MEMARAKTRLTKYSRLCKLGENFTQKGDTFNPAVPQQAALL